MILFSPKMLFNFFSTEICSNVVILFSQLLHKVKSIVVMMKQHITGKTGKFVYCQACTFKSQFLFFSGCCKADFIIWYLNPNGNHWTLINGASMLF